MLLQKQISELLRPPGGVPTTVLQDELLHRLIGQVSIATGPPAFLMQPGDSMLLTASQVLVTGLAANAEVMTQLCYRKSSTLGQVHES